MVSEIKPLPVVISQREATQDPLPNDVPIGRGSGWGNPFHIGEDGTRKEVLAKFDHYMVDKVVFAGTITKDQLAELLGTRLVCPGNCKPNNRCHGDIIRKWVAIELDRVEELSCPD